MVVVSRFRTRNVGVEDKNDDHWTTTTTPISRKIIAKWLLNRPMTVLSYFFEENQDFLINLKF